MQKFKNVAKLSGKFLNGYIFKMVKHFRKYFSTLLGIIAMTDDDILKI